MSLLERLEQKAKTLRTILTEYEVWDSHDCRRIHENNEGGEWVRLEDVWEAVKQATTPLTQLLETMPSIIVDPAGKYAEQRHWVDAKNVWVWFQQFQKAVGALVGEQTEQKEKQP